MSLYVANGVLAVVFISCVSPVWPFTTCDPLSVKKHVFWLWRLLLLERVCVRFADSNCIAGPTCRTINDNAEYRFTLGELVFL